MKGSIRMLVGFVLVLGGVGGIENSLEFPLDSLAITISGLALMAWGTFALKSEENTLFK